MRDGIFIDEAAETFVYTGPRERPWKPGYQRNSADFGMQVELPGRSIAVDRLATGIIVRDNGDVDVSGLDVGNVTVVGES